eukprot:Clim_evm7s149 gene=Clim_evmTU7s149
MAPNTESGISNDPVPRRAGVFGDSKECPSCHAVMGYEPRKIWNYEQQGKPPVVEDGLTPRQRVAKIAQNHVAGFSWMLDEGLAMAVKDTDPCYFKDGRGNEIKIQAVAASVGMPVLPERERYSINRRIFPAECRERAATYRARLQVKIIGNINDGEDIDMTRSAGQIPIMLQSSRCNLQGLEENDVIRHGEDAADPGGYFIINGNEKIVRLLILPRRNYPTAIQRPSFKNRGPGYTEFGVIMRCVREDQTGRTITLHYLSNGSVTLKFMHMKQEYLIPVVLIIKALKTVKDVEIYRNLVNAKSSSFSKDRAEIMLREALKLKLKDCDAARAYLGKRFRVAFGHLPDSMTDQEIGEYILQKVIFIHTEDFDDKLQSCLMMIRKLFALVSGEIEADNPDSPQLQELLLPGHLYNMIIKEKIQELVNAHRNAMVTELRRRPESALTDGPSLLKFSRRITYDIGEKLNYFMATGNLVSPSGLDLQQVSGFTIVADKLNMFRFLSHFRSVHRGAFFSELRTTTVRRLLGESWGFLCPVHTPDGAPCGLLNHLSSECEAVIDSHADPKTLKSILVEMGMQPDVVDNVPTSTALEVIADGVPIGRVPLNQGKALERSLRVLKADHAYPEVPEHLEVGLILPTTKGQYPGLFLFSSPARMMRPVYQLMESGEKSFTKESVGTFEQVYMDIACTQQDVVQDITTHIEIHPTNMLSVLANFTPFSDFNQSPRNMYQCQMAKQTMGVPCHAFNRRTDNKMYRLVTGQAPILRNKRYEEYAMDTYPSGTNAVVAVISYTGYDMEDAMIINKASYDRGFAHGIVYKTEFIDLTEKVSGGTHRRHVRFGKFPDDNRAKKLQADGLPAVGTKLTYGSAYYSYINEETEECKVEIYKGMEDAHVDQVRLLGNETGDGRAQRAAIKLRVTRNPSIGDKFSSRHGQKGICSTLWPQENMPFSESGMSPDIIFNPHGFPSRMTMGMLVEFLASKAGAQQGQFYDATPFTYGEEVAVDEEGNPFDVVQHYGDLLRKSGYAYCGTERLYSGITGTEFEADIFMGLVYYQRLRHMVADKYQVRSTGPVHNLTHQPIKGRKRAGGIRFGEMERDSLLSHGTAFLLQDRLLNCSDLCEVFLCRGCGSIVSPTIQSASLVARTRFVKCSNCNSSKNMVTINMPYVFRYLAAELLACNIKLQIDLK